MRDSLNDRNLIEHYFGKKIQILIKKANDVTQNNETLKIIFHCSLRNTGIFQKEEKRITTAQDTFLFSELLISNFEITPNIRKG